MWLRAQVHEYASDPRVIISVDETAAQVLIVRFYITDEACWSGQAIRVRLTVKESWPAITSRPGSPCSLTGDSAVTNALATWGQQYLGEVAAVVINFADVVWYFTQP